MYLFKHSTAKAGPFYYLIECCNSEAQDDTGANMCLARLFYSNHDNRLAARPCNCSRVALMLAVAGANLEKIIENHTVDCTSKDASYHQAEHGSRSANGHDLPDHAVNAHH